MMKRPVRIVKHFSRIFTKDGQFIRETGMRFTVTARLLGTTKVNTKNGPKELPYKECGHNHLTESGAQRCFKRMLNDYNYVRSCIAQEAADRLKAKRKVERFHAGAPLVALGPTQKKSLQPPVETCRFHPGAKVVNGRCTALDRIEIPGFNEGPIGNTD